MPAHTHRFFADAMLGRLARWLRILGYDTAYERAIQDDLLIERAMREDWWILTRDRYLAQRKVLRKRHTLIASDHWQDQLRQLRDDLEISFNVNEPRPFRCAGCNLPLISISSDDAAPLVPAFVASHYREFYQCRGCVRVYWPGTHWENLVGCLAALGKNDAHKGS